MGGYTLCAYSVAALTATALLGASGADLYASAPAQGARKLRADERA